jgi:hypothetical protein
MITDRVNAPPECPDLAGIPDRVNAPPECPDLAMIADRVNAPPECPDLARITDRVNAPPECPDLAGIADRVNAPPECPDLARIVLNLETIIDDVDPEDILDLFIQEDILSEDNRQSVLGNNPNTRLIRIFAFLNLLIQTFDPQAFITVFIQSLRRAYSHVADKIQNTSVESLDVGIG